MSTNQRYIFDLDAWRHKTDQDAKDWVESNFPNGFYSKEIVAGKDLFAKNEKIDDIWYEAWDLRALLEQAYMAGKESK